MASSKPDGYVNPTGMRHLASAHTVAEPRALVASGSGDRSAAEAEQETKRIEKIRSHASSHRTAGTVKLET